MTWFGWLLVLWWIFSTLVSVYAAGNKGEIGRSKSSVGGLLIGAGLNLLFIFLLLVVGTGYGL